MAEIDELTFEQRVKQKLDQAVQEAGEAPPEPPAEEPEEPSEEPSEEEPEEEPADEAPAVVEDEPEAPLEEEPEAEPEEEPELEEEPEAFDEAWQQFVAEHEALARYKSPDEADRGLVEARRTIQRLYQELNDRQVQQQPEQEQPQQLDVQAWSDWSAELVESGAGIDGANEALAQGGAQAFDIYMAHWQAVDDPEERIRAVAFNNEVQRQASTLQAIQAMQPQLKQSQDQRVAEEAVLARSIAAAKHPDFEEYSDEMDRIMNAENGPLDAGTRQWLFDEAQKGVEGKARAWEYVYLAAQASRGPRQQKARAVEGKRRTATADAAKIAATVSTSEGSGAHTPPSEAEQAVLRKRNAIRGQLGQPLLEE